MLKKSCISVLYPYKATSELDSLILYNSYLNLKESYKLTVARKMKADKMVT